MSTPTTTPDTERRLAELLEADRTFLWHPFTQMQVWPEDDPLVIERAEGNYLIDVLGRRYLDGVSSLWVTVHGHRKGELDEAIRAQLEKVAHSTLLGLANVPSIELAKKLISIAPPGLTRVFYSDSGSTAVEIAVKMAYQYWQLRGRTQKRRFVALREAYHGDTVGSVSVGGIDLFHQIFRSLLFEVERIPTPYAYRYEGEGDCAEACLRAAEELFERKHESLAALVIEPLVQGAAGMLVQPKGFLAALAKLCRRYEVLLICDEVATGFGRTGTMFAVEQEDVRPDLMCVAKGLTGGYLPLAATLTTEEIYSAFLGTVAEKRTFFHGHTYTGNPLACAVALANLELFEKERTLEKMKPTVEVLTRKLEEIARHPHVGEVRQRGMMIGIELVKDRATREEYPYGDRVGFQVCQEVRRRGIILRPLGNVVVLMPPLSLTPDEALWLGDAVYESIDAVTRERR
ncbi:MAG: adenosylmethionine--8-amino-7-oxononanoate transaminase [Myxococcaceae bacterium]|nr:adenosylmethionine--8-amino-7-oxononanoate transaminase [Myxococcaceae bacterium]